MKKGFTLIELLVVVLIIGILAAIALPQYINAVNKSRFSQNFIMAKAMRDANDRVFLATGNYASSFDEFDIQIPGTTATCPGGAISCLKDGRYGYLLFSSGLVQAYLLKSASDSVEFGTVLALIEIPNPGPNAKTYCITGTTEPEKGEKLCKSLGGKQRAGYPRYFEIN
ncbi:PilE-like protein [Elusimicrobium minutum Pei191]|uniref:PilE-like protein n=1 Tax=Elusimicrobium minutum (strain Pei191) TaxID=445932 RepID=B2KE65_ELUMP|nr:prepilin-type N-terminal cleavage/methylation domain-containing protein [Elusimicrobium minutum]ACC98811.1 PilE-like protein [Elusimicrobium minutum Pei191]